MVDVSGGADKVALGADARPCGPSVLVMLAQVRPAAVRRRSTIHRRERGGGRNACGLRDNRTSAALSDKKLHARQLPKDARRKNFGTGVIYIPRETASKTIDTAHGKVDLDDTESELVLEPYLHAVTCVVSWR